MSYYTIGAAYAGYCIAISESDTISVYKINNGVVNMTVPMIEDDKVIEIIKATRLWLDSGFDLELSQFLLKTLG